MCSQKCHKLQENVDKQCKIRPKHFLSDFIFFHFRNIPNMGNACCLALNTPFLRLLQSRGVESGAWMPLELAANCRWLRAAGWLQAEAGLERAPSPPLHTVPPGLEDFPIQPLHKSRRSHFIKGFSVSAMLNILKRCPVR